MTATEVSDSTATQLTSASLALYWLGQGLTILIWIWSICALSFMDFLPPVVATVLAASLLAGVVAASWRWSLQRQSSRSVLLACAVVAIVWLFVRPSNQRDWAMDQRVTPVGIVSDSLLTIRNMRQVELQSGEVAAVRHYEQNYDLDGLSRVWLGVEYFTDLRSLAHTFVTFEFTSKPVNQFLTFSVEVRREKGESFGMLPGMFRQFELMYVVSDERNMIGNRMLTSEDRFHLYPMRTNATGRKALLLDMVKRMNALQREPEFYHSFCNNCTNNLVWHLNRVADNRLSPYHPHVVFSGFCDRAAYRFGLIDTDLSFAEAREKFRIDDRGRDIVDRDDFSELIRRLSK